MNGKHFNVLIYVCLKYIMFLNLDPINNDLLKDVPFLRFFAVGENSLRFPEILLVLIVLFSNIKLFIVLSDYIQETVELFLPL